MTNCACLVYLPSCSCPLRLDDSASPSHSCERRAGNFRLLGRFNPLIDGNSDIKSSCIGNNKSNIAKLVNKKCPRQSLTYNRSNMASESDSCRQQRQQHPNKYFHHYRHHHHHHHSQRSNPSTTIFAWLILFVCILARSTNGQTDSYLYSDHAPAQTGPSLCPLVPSCQCKWSNGKQEASCEKRNLYTIPSQLPPDTQVLDMTGNTLNVLMRDIFQDKHLTNLQRLYLSDCKITFVSDQAFTRLTNLVELDLSHNFLKQVSIKTFEQLNHSLRKLNLAHNPIQTIEPGTFSSLTHLNTLDLSNCQLSQLKPGVFQGLGQLKELKLVDNRLTQLPVPVLSDLSHEYLTMDLFGNSWHCDCELKQSMDWMSRNRVQIAVWPSCATPTKHKDVRWINVRPDDFLCPPTVINKQNELVVGAGSNVSLACQARGSPPLTFVWFQDEKNLTTSFSNTTEQPASTKLLEERRYEIAEELGPNTTTSLLYLYDLQLSDTSLFLCWVENGAGYSHANFSLTVNNSPPAQLAGGTATSYSLWDSIGLSASEAQLGIVSIVFVVILAAAILLLLMLKHNRNGPIKNSKSDDLKQARIAHISTLAGPNGNAKFAVSGDLHHQSMLAESDDYGDSDDQSSTNSSSSCHKNTRLDYDGFIEHMRTGIINIDYHSMSPVGQFNTLKNQPNVDVSAATPQQHQQLRLMNQRMLQGNHLSQQHEQPNLSANQHAMHHFPSASNTSSVPPYYGSGNGSASMATTTSDLSPGSGSGNTNLGPTTNCDSQQFNDMIGPHTNNTTTSYAGAYQGGYGHGSAHVADEQADNTNSIPQMYYDAGRVDSHLAGYHPAMYATGANGQLVMPDGRMLHGQQHNSGAQDASPDSERTMRLLYEQQQQRQLRLDQGFQIL